MFHQNEAKQMSSSLGLADAAHAVVDGRADSAREGRTLRQEVLRFAYPH